MRPQLVFTGPTLSHAEAHETLDAIYLPPATQGSIISAVRRFDPTAILIIDGGFQTEPAVRHKEILWALSLGIPVVGAASMGALRAAELFPHMQGVGLIYRWYRRFPFAPDDAVAVLHGPAAVNFTPLTHALIDLRMTVRAAHRRRLISADLRARLEGAAQRLNFRDRTLGRMVSDALHEDEPAVETCREILDSALLQQKKQDALEALRFLRRDAFPPPHALPNLTLTAAFVRDVEDAGLTL
jgi:hypothetical protein